MIMEKDTLKTKTIEALREEEFRIIEVKFRPTAENFARYFYDLIKQDGYDVSFVEVYETPNNCAIYGE
ncbi:6-carboxytetrahydropterin synthase [Anaerostipes caccae]|uniref:6-carboxytetrahydropterin synthase n=1 Tax=Anaerostipes caccae TaxID=105841 RepID=UPI0021090CC1|nr:6-carboxytetrahydropterin synthase [Anaerostipes caccae]MCQ4987223.1 6-carboxytetrahydropterin synthase [Anaerostipes caccae]